MLKKRLAYLRRYTSLRIVLVVPFILQMSAIVALVSYLSYRNGQQAVQSVAFQLCAEINDRIHQELEVLLTAPHVVHKNTAAAIRLGHIDPRDSVALRRYFWEQVKIMPNVDDIGIGNAQGEVVAASAAIDNGEIRLSDATTDFNLKIYDVDPRGKPLSLKKQVPDFNPQERPWYQAAAIAGRPTWTEIYPTFGDLGLAISAVHPIYGQRGELEAVLYNLFHLSQIGDFLQSLKIGQTGQSFILEPGGWLVATSTGEALVHQKNASKERLRAIDSSNAVTRATSDYILSNIGDLRDYTETKQIRFEIDQKPYFLQIQPFQDGKGLEWLVVVVVPEADFMAQIYTNTGNTAGLSLIALLLAAIAGIATARWITEPVAQVVEASNALAQDYSAQRVTATAPQEMHQLARAFNYMADRLSASFVELETKNADLQRLDELKDEFLANTSHELRTPLNGMIGIAESMLTGATGTLSAEQTQNLNLLTYSGKQLVALIDDILDFAKLQHQELQLLLQPVSLREVVDVVLSLDRMLVGHKPLKLCNQIAINLPLVEADENRLQQILHNLVSNAIKFTFEGQIDITAEVLNTTPAWMKVSITDTGIGIPADKRDRIFEAFEQVDGAANRRYGGNGLGLAIAQNLVQLHGGTIEVVSTPGRGSTFSFTLPISQQQFSVPLATPITNTAVVREELVFNPVSQAVKADNVFVTSPSWQALKPSKTMPNSVLPEGNPRILVVDDEPINLQVISNFLQPENYTLTFANDGPTALAQIETGVIPDLILLDVMMPRMTGYEVLQTIRQHYSADRLPIVLVSARNQPKDIVLGLEYGANDYLTKPVSRDELLARIQTHLQIRQLEQETIRLTVAHERQLAQFLDALPVGVAVHRPDGSVIYLNQAAKRILQTDIVPEAEAEALAMAYQVYRVGTQNLYPTSEMPVMLALQGSNVRRDDLELRFKETVVPLEVLGIPIFDAQGDIEYAIATFQDISERKRAEKILADYSRELEQEVHQRTTELAHTNQQLQAEVHERQLAEQKLQFVNQELRRIATMDGLTQVANRRCFDQQLQQEWGRLLREGQPLALILFDVDFFKPYNDFYGHQAGDDCLIQVAKAAKQALHRTADFVARYGGEEFVVILPNTHRVGAIAVAERIQYYLRQQAIPHAKSSVSPVVSISLGIACIVPDGDRSPETLVAMADQALYTAKQRGRDRYITHE